MSSGLTQRELAALVGTTPSVICRLEDADYAGHSLSMPTRIAEALGRSMEIRFTPAASARPAKSTSKLKAPPSPKAQETPKAAAAARVQKTPKARTVTTSTITVSSSSLPARKKPAHLRLFRGYTRTGKVLH